MFPILLENQLLFSEFELFVEAIDNVHELALSGNQQFPVSFVSLLCNSTLIYVLDCLHDVFILF